MNSPDLMIGVASALLLTVLGLAGLYLTGSHRDTIPGQQRLFLAAMAIRFTATLALHQTSLYEVLIGSADASGWEGGRGFKEAIDQSELGPVAIPQEMGNVFQRYNQGYGTFLGLYFYVTRLDSELSAAAFSCFCGAMTAVMAYRLARIIFSERAAVQTGWSICLFPSMIVWSIQTIKEPVVIFWEVVGIYACTYLKTRHFSLRHILLWVMSILVVLPLRFYAVYALGGTLLLGMLIPGSGKGRIHLGSALTGGAMLIFVLSMASDSVRTHQEVYESYDLDRVQGFRDAVTRGEGSGSGVKLGYDLLSNRGLILGTLVGALHLLLAPFPWQFSGSSMRFLLTAPEMAVWWFLVARGLPRGLAVCLRRQPGDVLPMLLFMIALGSVYSLMFGNIGIVYRQRAQLLPYLSMIIMVGFEARRNCRIGDEDDRSPVEPCSMLASVPSPLERHP